MLNTDKIFSAAPQALGFIYQIRYALLHSFNLSETTEIFIEGDDDLSIHDGSNVIGLGSLKHRSSDNVLTDSSSVFWKSIRIWLTRYNQYAKQVCLTQFYLFTTSKVSDNTFVKLFEDKSNIEDIITKIMDYGSFTDQTIIKEIVSEFTKLTFDEQKDFLQRIEIIDQSIRIDDIPNKIMNTFLGAVKREYRKLVFERLEGWWQDRTIRIMVEPNSPCISVSEINDKLAFINDEYKSDNLPITFKNKVPNEHVDPENDSRLFVKQLKLIDVSVERIEFAILDYFRAFEQRSYWAKESLVDWREISDYEENLISEWKRLKAQYLESLSSEEESEIKEVGRKIYNWSQNVSNLNIRERVQEPYIIRGTFHILANSEPIPRVFWHPYTLEKISETVMKA